MNVHEVEKLAIPALQNVLMWDAAELEWRIGHARVMIEGVPVFLCACTVEEAHDMISGDLPVPVFTVVTHWARLPANPGEIA